MNFGKTLVGAAIGAAVGIGAHVALEYFHGEAFWFPVITGTLTGLGIRRLDTSVATSASYLRGALAGLVSLAAIFGGFWVSSQARIAKMTSESENTPPPALIIPAETEEAEETDEATEVEPVEIELPTRVASTGTPTEAKGDSARDFDVWGFVMIGLGAFLAYELARGNTVVPNEGEEDEQAQQDQAANEGDSGEA